MAEAIRQAQKSRDEGGIPIGAALGSQELGIVSSGHNNRVQDGDPTGHGEMNCFRAAGRRSDWSRLTLATTLSPCIMCSGATLLFKVPRVIIGERSNFLGAEDLLRQHGVSLACVDDQACIDMMASFIADQPEVWNEDIAEHGDVA